MGGVVVEATTISKIGWCLIGEHLVVALQMRESIYRTISIVEMFVLFWWCSFLKKLLLENWIGLSKWDGRRSFFEEYVRSLIEVRWEREREMTKIESPKVEDVFDEWSYYCEGKKTNEWMNGDWLMMKMSLLNLIRGVLKLVVWNLRIIWAWLCYCCCWYWLMRGGWVVLIWWIWKHTHEAW